MSAVLLCLAGVALCWPSKRPARRQTRLRPAQRPRRHELAAWADRRAAAAAAAVLAGLAGAALTTPVVAVLAGAAAGLGAGALQRRRRGIVGQQQVAALAEALGVLAAELRAGRSVHDAAGTAVAGCPHPDAAAALGPVLRLGVAPDRDRSPIAVGTGSVLTRIAAAVRLSARTGCSLAAVVTAVEDDLRARGRAEAELRVAVAGPRASATVLAGLPVLGLLMGSGVGADPWRVLTTTGTGTVLLVTGVVLEGAGLAWSAQLLRRAVQR